MRAARIAARPRRQGGGRRGVPHRRHLRDPRLRAEEDPGLRQPLRRCLRRRAGLWLVRRPPRLSTGRLCAPPRRRRSRGSPSIYAANLQRANVEIFRQRAHVTGRQRGRARRRDAASARATSWSRPAALQNFTRTSRALSTPSPPTKSSTCPPSRAGCWWSAAAISRWSSHACSAASAPRSPCRCAATTSCAASTMTCAQGLRDEMTRAGVKFRFGRLPIADPQRGRRKARDDDRRRDAGGRPGAHRHRPAPQHARARSRNSRRAARRQRRRDRRRALDQQRAVDPRHRRRDRPHQPDAGGDPRRPLAGRPAVRRRDARSQLRRGGDRRVLDAGDRRRSA